MVYLVRTSRYLKFDESIEEKTTKLFEHLNNNYPQIKDMKFLWNVTGPINEVHWMMQFDSLADEDEFAAKVIQDKVYHDWFKASEGIITPGFDRLYRDAPMG